LTRSGRGWYVPRRMRPRSLTPRLLVAVTGFALLGACNSTILPPATTANVVDTVTLYALNGTPLGTPSAYAISGPLVVRTDLSASFDFAFNIDTLHRPVLVPTGVLALGVVQASTQPGFVLSSSTFADLTQAPTGGYEIDSALVVAVGNVIIARSRGLTCSDGTTNTLYAKLHVLAISTTARTIQFEALADQNCGYVGLEPGLPQQ